jgi:plastocyanin
VLAELAAAAAVSLVGTVGTNDGFDIGLADEAGARVTHVDPGTFALTVRDRSDFHNFHLFGPGGVDVATTVEFKGEQSFSITLVEGIYTVQCDPHQNQGMRVQFTVGSATLPQPVPVKKATASIVGSRATIRGLGTGKVAITVTDRSKTDGFLLQGPGIAKKTGIAFTGTVTWTVTLRAGAYTWGSVKHPGLRRRISLKS